MTLQVKRMKLYITEDIEFMTPRDFDIPTPAVIHRERMLAARMNDWVEDYNAEMESKRSNWLVEKWYR